MSHFRPKYEEVKEQMAAEYVIKATLAQLGNLTEKEVKEYMQQHGDYGMLAAHIYKTHIEKQD